MSRTPATCPYRQPLPVPSGNATHACMLALGISGAENPGLCAVTEHECTLCCERMPPSAEDPNGIVASTLFKALQQIKNAGGVPGCDAATATMMLPLVMRFLDVSSNRPGQRTGAARPHPCRHLGAQTGEEQCRTCRGNVRRKVFQCHHPRHQSTTIQQCQRCRDYKPRPPSQNVARWAVGMTTAPRASSTLNRTLRSLRKAGWTERVHLFAESGTSTWSARLIGAPLTIIRRKSPALGAWSNFFLGLQELYLRQPDADAYLMVQDDVVFCRDLRAYLEARLWPKGAAVGVVSLHTPSHLTAERPQGFFHAELGWQAWGAQALIFPNAAARAFLSDAKVVAHRQKGILDGTKNVDSVIGDWCSRTKHHFWMHTPSLAEHIGATSTLWPGLGLDGHRSSADFPGEHTSAALLPAPPPPAAAKEPITVAPAPSPAHQPVLPAPAAPLVLPPPAHVPLDTGRAHPVAILCVHFNFAGFVEPRRNLMRFLLQCRSFGIAVYGMEICLHGTPPMTAGFPGWWVENISQNGILWQKEAAINELARRVPRHCQILAWVDTDIWFENPKWPEDLVRMVENGTRVMQLFERAHWTDREGRIELTRESAVKARNHEQAHPGFAWAAMRDFWFLSPGLYDLSLAGSGDTVTAAILLDVPLSHSIRTAIGHAQTASRRHYDAWYSATRRWCRDRVGFLPGEVWHEWHGERSERQYSSRRAMMRNFEPSHIVRTSSGLIEWSESAPSELREGLARYFLTRKEDG